MKQALEALELLAKWEHPASNITTKNGGRIYPHRVASDAAAALRAAIEQAQGLAEKIPAKGTLLEQTLGKVWDEMPHTALMDALVGGTGVMLGDKRIDPASIYKQPEQEPVAHTLNCVCGAVWDVSPNGGEEMVHAPTPQPRQWQDLTEFEKVNIAIDCGCADVAWMDFADAIEANLKENNNG